jgi:hypothetical protein
VASQEQEQVPDPGRNGDDDDCHPVTAGPVRFADFQLTNPLRPPAWRWERAMHLLERRQPASAPFDDAATQVAFRFAMELGRCRGEEQWEALARRMPTTALAYKLYTADAVERAMVEGWILTGEGDTRVAEVLGTLPRVVTGYRRLFFDVSGRLSCWPYINLMALGKRLGQVTVADTPFWIRFFAWMGGSKVLNEIGAVLLDPAGYSLFGRGNLKLVEKLQGLMAVLSMPLAEDSQADAVEERGECVGQWSPLVEMIEEELGKGRSLEEIVKPVIHELRQCTIADEVAAEANTAACALAGAGGGL